MVETKNIASLKKQLKGEIQELSKLGEKEKTLPELINATNVLRINEHLTKVNKTKTKLLETYEQYTKELESVISTMSEIYNQLKHQKKPRKSVKRTVRKPLKKRKPAKKTSSKSKKKKLKRKNANKRKN